MKIPFCLLALATFAFANLFAKDTDWIPLFDGKTLAGWKANESPETWSVKEGALVTQGVRSHLFYEGEVANARFKNFEFVAEVKTLPGSNSGIYIHTKFQDEGWPAVGYECQVINSAPPNDDPKAYIERKMTGSIYAVRNTWVAPAKDNEWFEYRIVVSGKTIQTYIDGELVCEYTEPKNPWRPDDKKERLLGSGTFALQGHDPGSVVAYRNIRVKLLPDDVPSLGAPLTDAELDRLVTKFSNDNVALIDVGVHPSLMNAYSHDQLETARRLGLTLLRGADTGNSLVVVDREKAPSVEALKEAKARGQKIAFSSGGAFDLDHFKLRLQAMEAAELGWRDLWTP